MFGFVMAAAFATALTQESEASIVERIVAIVGERPILLSDLRKRALPFRIHIAASAQHPAAAAAQETGMYRELLNKMVDDRLEELAADKAHVNVTSEEIDRGISKKAESINLSVRELLAEAKRQGLSEQDYRDELRRQVLEGKLIQLRVLPRVRVTDEDARAAYARWIKEMGAEMLVDIRILAMRMPTGASTEHLHAQEALAASIVARARAGESFCTLASQYSDDVQTKGTCGSRGPQPMSSLLPQLQDTVKSMKDGETADPVSYQNEAILIVQMAKAPHVPAYDEVKGAMQERAMGELIERQRKAWLQELRRGVYVDVRL